MKPYRAPAPRPLTEEDLPPKKEKRPMHWLIKTGLFGSASLGLSYLGAWLMDAGHLRGSAVANLTFYIIFIVAFGLGAITLACVLTKGKF